jgi:hypothetical protein
MQRRFAARLAVVLLVVLWVPTVSQAREPGREFEMTAIVDSSQGTRRMHGTLVINRFSDPETGRQLRSVLEAGGQGALLAALREHRDGRIRLGALEVPVNLVLAEDLGRGTFRYVVVTARRLRVHEVDLGQDSLAYPFGVMVFEVGGFGKGDGTIYPAAALSVADDGTVAVDQYEIDPGRLAEIKKTR